MYHLTTCLGSPRHKWTAGGGKTRGRRCGMEGLQRTRLRSISQRRQGEKNTSLITRQKELDKSHVTGLAGWQLEQLKVQ